MSERTTRGHEEIRKWMLLVCSCGAHGDLRHGGHENHPCAVVPVVAEADVAQVLEERLLWDDTGEPTDIAINETLAHIASELGIDLQKEEK